MSGYLTLAKKASRSRFADPYAIIGAVEQRALAMGGGEGAIIGIGGALAVTGLAGLGISIALLAKAKYGWAAATFFGFTPLALLLIGGVSIGIMAASSSATASSRGAGTPTTTTRTSSVSFPSDWRGM